MENLPRASNIDNVNCVYDLLGSVWTRILGKTSGVSGQKIEQRIWCTSITLCKNGMCSHQSHSLRVWKYEGKDSVIMNILILILCSLNLGLPNFNSLYIFSFIEEKKSAPTEEQGWMLYYQSLLQLKDDVASRWNSSQNHLLTLQVIRHRINSMEFLGRWGHLICFSRLTILQTPAREIVV